MFSLPFLVVMVLYGILILIPIIFFLFGVYTIVAAGELSLTSFLMTFFVGGSMFLIIVFTFSFLAENNISASSDFSPLENIWVAHQETFE